MPFEPDDETLSMLKNSVKEFVLREVEPMASRIDNEDYFPESVFKKMGKMGYLGITVPAEYGGSGLNIAAQAIIEEELGYSSPSLALSYGAHSNLCLDNLYRNGSELIRRDYVPKLASGEWIGSLALTEPGSGSDALGMKSEAWKDGDKIILNGSKTLITNAPFSDLFLVYARTGDSYSAFVVLSSDKGFSRGKKFNKMGMRGSPTGEIYFDNIVLGKDRVVGEYGNGKDIILSGLNSERVVLSFIFIGLARRALETAIEYSTQRKQFNTHLYRFELIEEKLAYMYTKYETSKLLAEKALRNLERNRMDSLSAAAAIMHSTESAEYISREAIQILGGLGYTKDMVVERLMRDAILGQIGAGTTEIRKHLIASALVKSFKKDPEILGKA
ncbi:MAG: acyl-CoA dehydrogenase family protein [Thermoplasmatales archaeon]|nr:acyl-CoA dehydrogenase family protein [Thermoplasmatales archaeon]MCW6169924.1 acyl-CoA dehydrogenase family protein [Thermoplasmatales archaeon]